MKGETKVWSLTPKTIVKRVQEHVENIMINVTCRVASHNKTGNFEKDAMQEYVSRVFLEKYESRIEEELKSDFVKVFKILIQNEVETMVPKEFQRQYLKDYEMYILRQLVEECKENLRLRKLFM